MFAKPSFLIWALSLVILIVAAAGYVDTSDADPSIATAEAILDHGRLGLEGEQNTFLYARGTDGRFYTKLGLGMPFLYIPAILAARLHYEYSQGQEDMKRLTQFYVSLVNPVLGSLIVLMLFLCLNHLTGSVSESVWVAIVFFFGTLLFPYSKTSHREIFQALCLLTAFYFSLREKFLIAGIAAGAGILTKQAFVVALVPLAAWVLTQRKFIFAAPIVASLCVWLFFSTFCLGSITSTGYDATTAAKASTFWSHSFLKGLHLQFTSYRSGIFAYAPVLILAFWALLQKMVNRNLNHLEICVVATVLLQASLYALWFDPMGGEALGPRYLVTVLPLFAFLIVRTNYWNVARPIAVPIAVLSICWQLVFVSVKSQQYATLEHYAGVPLTAPHWLAQLKFFKHKWKAKDEIYDLATFGGPNQTVHLNEFETLRGYNYWWLHLRRHQIEESARAVSRMGVATLFTNPQSTPHP